MAVNGEDVSQVGEGRLLAHVLERVRTSLSGADGHDLIDLVPLRSIFAGVLQAPRSRDEEAARTGVVSRNAPVGTAMGLDFRVKPSGGDPVVISLGISWAHYYAVFPTFEQLRLVTATDVKPPSMPSAAPESPSLTTAGEPTDESVEAADLSAEESPVAEEETEPDSSGHLTLPRVWRRVAAEAQVSSVAIKPSLSSTVEDAALAQAVERVQASVSSDPHRWHHLGEPKERSRVLGSVSVSNSETAYENALQSKRGKPAETPDWRVAVHIDVEPDGSLVGVWRVRVLLSNQTSERGATDTDPGLEDRAMYDARLTATIQQGDLVPFDFLLAPKDYRSARTMHAKGINCCATWTPASPQQITTETLPIYEQPLYRTRDSLAIEFDALAEGDPEVVLLPIHEQMQAYVKQWRDFLTSQDAARLSEAEHSQCSRDCSAFEEEAREFKLGLEVLRRDARLRTAFQKMNQAFGILGQRSGGKLKAWRLFQIAFICSQLPSLAVRELKAGSDEEYGDAIRAHFNDVGILWFPTGGGKTEAYLGLIGTAMLYDRIRGKDRGVTAWMRFPLRMLSLQQLDRLAKVVAVLNELRASDPTISGGDPFGIGYFAGDNNTPNAVSDDDMQRYERNPTLREGVKLLRQCPHCGAPLNLVAHRPSWRLRHVCTNEGCFSNISESLGDVRGSLPVYVVDNEVYRYLPSVMVGTVDKLAIIGRSRTFHQVLRGVTQKCPQHGYTSYGECIEHWTGCKRTRSQLDVLRPIADPGPSLLIQDELHLLRDELGVFNGHYEGLVKYLGAWAYMPAKVLCATATIEAYDIQAFHIYLAAARRFPQPGWLAGESFYATSAPLRYRRFYVGVYCHTRAIEDAALRVTALYQREIRRLRADLPLCAKIMASETVDDAELKATLRLHDLSLCYVNRKSVGSNLIDKLGRTNQVLTREGLGEMRGAVLTSDQTIEEIGATIDLIERQLFETDEPRLDVVAATSLISHGVDLERINMMCVCGMPSHYAEYVQASSRCARSHPGAIFVCFNGRDPRERSQYEFFYQMHQHMDRLIEAVAVNRYASYAPKKTVPGLLIGLLLNGYTPDLHGTRIKKPLDHVPTLQGAIGMRPADGGACITADALRTDLERIIGVDDLHPPASPAQIANAKQQLHLAFDDAWSAISRTMESKAQDVLSPITSFRDVDEGTEFGSKDSASVVTRLRVR